MKNLLILVSLFGAAFGSTATTTATGTTATTSSASSTTLAPVTTTVCPSSSSHHHSRSHHHHHHHHSKCHSEHKHHSKCHSERKPCCETKTVTTHIDHKPCCLFIHPCPINPTSYVTSTSMVAPTSQAVPVCTPCTTVVTQTVRPAEVCTTMIFCDVADQSADCVRFSEEQIQSIAQLALRSNGRVLVNGNLVAFESHQNSGGSGSGSGSGSGTVKVVSSSSVVTVTGLNANDAPATYYGATLMSIMVALAMAVFAI